MFKGQGHQAALLTAALTRQAAAAVTVGTYCYVAVCRRGRLGGTRRFGAHRGRRGAGHIVAASRTACSIKASYIIQISHSHSFKSIRITISRNGFLSYNTVPVLYRLRLQ